MACGVLVTCSCLSSLFEITVGAAVLFNPFDIDSIAAGLYSRLPPKVEVRKCSKKVSIGPVNLTGMKQLEKHSMSSTSLLKGNHFNDTGRRGNEGDRSNMTYELLTRLKSGIPKPVKRFLRLAVTYPTYWMRLQRNFAYDRRRFAKYSSADSILRRKTQLRSWITGDYHKIEKALALRSPRPGFGQAVVGRLLDNLERFLDEHGIDENCVIAINALFEYMKLNKERGVELPMLYARIECLSTAPGYKKFNEGQGGTIRLDREEVLRQSRIDLKNFFESRHSIRQFSDEPVSKELVEEAVRLARTTPSVCNRQSWKVHAFSEPDLLENVVACQMGNQGFGEQLKVALVVTSSTETFFSVGERNQCWIDGGMFSMSILYALHSLGLGTISLNWSVEKAADEELHRVASIPESEVIIMMIGIGLLPESLRVAQSKRRPLEEILIWDRGVESDAEGEKSWS